MGRTRETLSKQQRPLWIVDTIILMYEAAAVPAPSDIICPSVGAVATSWVGMRAVPPWVTCGVASWSVTHSGQSEHLSVRRFWDGWMDGCRQIYHTCEFIYARSQPLQSARRHMHFICCCWKSSSIYRTDSYLQNVRKQGGGRSSSSFCFPAPVFSFLE